MKKKYTAQQLHSKFKDKYVEIGQFYDYDEQCWMYEVRKVYDEIHENTTLGQDVETSLEYRR